jgi:hypothetical protein
LSIDHAGAGKAQDIADFVAGMRAMKAASHLGSEHELPSRLKP